MTKPKVNNDGRDPDPEDDWEDDMEIEDEFDGIPDEVLEEIESHDLDMSDDDLLVEEQYLTDDEEMGQLYD